MKFDENFIKREHELLARYCIANVLALKKEASILMNEGYFARSHFLIVTALEELAKASILIREKEEIDLEKIKGLISHRYKASEIMSIMSFYLNIPPKEADIQWAESRIPDMREETLYVGLKFLPKNNKFPDNKYWEKRAKAFFGHLEIFEKKLLKLADKKA